MYIAQEIRKKSIVEYILFMWQMEDLIRSFGCNLSSIRDNYIAKFENYSEEQKEAETDWFGHLIRMMNEEGKREKGHLNVHDVLVKDVSDLHHQLLSSTRFPYYNAQYYKVLPFIVELRQRGQQDTSEVETCLNALYGVMMLRLRQKEISTETQHAVQEITTLMGMLSDYYIKDRTEGLQWE